jgi:hypothetical protein
VSGHEGTDEKEMADQLARLGPIGYRALLSSLLQVNVYVTHSLLNVLVQIANKMGLKKILKWAQWASYQQNKGAVKLEQRPAMMGGRTVT